MKKSYKRHLLGENMEISAMFGATQKIITQNIFDLLFNNGIRQRSFLRLVHFCKTCSWPYHKQNLAFANSFLLTY